MIISSREMKNFHMENKTHFKTKEQKGTELEFSDTLSAPFDIKIYGASGQKVTEQGKNLFNKERHEIIGGYVAFDISLLEIGKKYTFSSTKPFKWVKISYSRDGWNSTYYSGEGTSVWKFTMQKHANISDNQTQYIFIDSKTDISDFDGVDIQIEEGTTQTDYEPFIPDSPSKDYPSEIIPLENIKVKCTNGDIEKKVSLSIPIYEIMGVKDSIEYDSLTNKTILKSYIDKSKLDGTKPLSEQGAALRSEPLITEVETALKGFKAIQGGCSVLATGSIGEEEKNAYIEAKVKVLK